MSLIVLLGPQRFRPTLRETIDSLGVDGPVAVITAGWQERESEYGELREHLGCEIHDLLLYHRHDDVLLRDRPLAEAMFERQRRLRRQRAHTAEQFKHQYLLPRPGLDADLENPDH